MKDEDVELLFCVSLRVEETIASITLIQSI